MAGIGHVVGSAILALRSTDGGHTRNYIGLQASRADSLSASNLRASYAGIFKLDLTESSLILVRRTHIAPEYHDIHGPKPQYPHLGGARL